MAHKRLIEDRLLHIYSFKFTVAQAFYRTLPRQPVFSPEVVYIRFLQISTPFLDERQKAFNDMMNSFETEASSTSAMKPKLFFDLLLDSIRCESHNHVIRVSPIFRQNQMCDFLPEEVTFSLGRLI